MPNARINTPVVNARIGSTIANVRSSNFQTGVETMTTTMGGSPIGLLLALTYAVASTTTTFKGDQRPNVLIKTT